MTAITIVTHAAMPAGAPDDLRLADALAAAGATIRYAVWDDPAIDWRATPVTVVRSTWDYYLEPASWYAWLEHAGARTRLVNPADLLRWNSEKGYLLDLAAVGIPIVPTLLLERDDPVDPGLACEARGWQDVGIKPAMGASAAGARRFTNEAIATDGAAHIAELLRRRTRVLIQPYQSAVETVRERSLIFMAGVFSHGFTKPAFLSGTGNDTLRVHFPDDEELGLARLAISVAPAAPLYARVDILPSATGPLLMELELIEPQLALHLKPGAAQRFAAALLADQDLAGAMR